MARTGPVTKDTSAVALGLAQIRVGKSAAHIASASPALLSTDSIGALANTKYVGEISYWKLKSGFPLLEDITLPIEEAAKLECAFKEISSKNLAMARGIDVFADVVATVAEVSNNSIGGAVVGSVAVTDAGGVTNEVFTVIVEAEAAGTTTYSVYGDSSGKVLDSVTDASEQEADNNGNPYFTIPADFFDASWLADETYLFKTTAFEAGAASFSDNHAGAINLGALKAPEYVRMEAVYTYPNGINHMYVIFPRANVVSSVELDFQAEDAATVPITFEAKRADPEVVGGHASWADAPLGKIIFD